MYQEATGPSYTNKTGTVTYDKRLSSSGKVSSSAVTGVELGRVEQAPISNISAPSEMNFSTVVSISFSDRELHDV